MDYAQAYTARRWAVPNLDEPEKDRYNEEALLDPFELKRVRSCIAKFRSQRRLVLACIQVKLRRPPATSQVGAKPKAGDVPKAVQVLRLRNLQLS